MSIVNGNGKGNLLISYLFPKESGIKEQCELEAKIGRAISEVMAKYFPKVRYIMGADEDTSPQVLEKKWEPVINAHGELTGFICECGCNSNSISNFCSNCGAKMNNFDIRGRIEQAIARLN